MTSEQIRFAFADRMRSARRRMKLSQRRLALQLGVCPSFVNHLEAGRRLPSLPNLYAIANLLNVRPQRLIP